MTFTMNAPDPLDPYHIPQVFVRFIVHSKVGKQIVGQYYYIDERQSIWSNLPDNGRRTRIRDPAGLPGRPG